MAEATADLTMLRKSREPIVFQARVRIDKLHTRNARSIHLNEHQVPHFPRLDMNYLKELTAANSRRIPVSERRGRRLAGLDPSFPPLECAQVSSALKELREIGRQPVSTQYLFDRGAQWITEDRALRRAIPSTLESNIIFLLKYSIKLSDTGANPSASTHIERYLQQPPRIQDRYTRRASEATQDPTIATVTRNIGGISIRGTDRCSWRNAEIDNNRGRCSTPVMDVYELSEAKLQTLNLDFTKKELSG
ncbi:uncharacterized protein LOC117175270 [Belonocnema kinseyi]|uniref:uncharacterized protein LOC117175270 n=1 Tax=Belonocnema kinseyi TaxID=2817044 RepID=UPI00143CFCD7|nr:uncharacterized protein LOC117175270 [Belonocnema kinseyi]